MDIDLGMEPVRLTIGNPKRLMVEMDYHEFDQLATDVAASAKDDMAWLDKLREGMKKIGSYTRFSEDGKIDAPAAQGMPDEWAPGRPILASHLAHFFTKWMEAREASAKKS